MRHSIMRLACVTALLLGVSVQVSAQSQKFAIQSYSIKGNALISSAQLQALVQPFIGEQRSYADIQKALEQVENEYRWLGYGAVQVYVPEQEITSGVVSLQVLEMELDQILTDADPVFDRDNLLASLPSLRIGYSPKTQEIAQNVQMINENPAKKVEVVMAMSEKEGKIDTRIKVKSESPFSVTLTGDNTGNASTGPNRVGATVSHANLFNRDQVLSASYITSLEEPSKVGVYALNYQLPLYARSGSFGLSLVHSNVSAGTVSIPGGSLGFAGQGTMLGGRYTHHLPRMGTYSHRLTAAVDHKQFDNNCQLMVNGMMADCGSAGEDIIAVPLTLGYAGMQLDAGTLWEVGASVSHNLAGSDAAQFERVLPNRDAKQGFSILRANASVFSTFGQSDWQWRAALQGQWADTALISGEQIGLAGANSLRGLNERQLAADTGWAGVLEFYTPDFASLYGKEYGSLRLVAFMDRVTGDNLHAKGDSLASLAASSVGVGLRYNLAKDVMVRMDYGRIASLEATSASGKSAEIERLYRDTDRIHTSLMVRF